MKISAISFVAAFAALGICPSIRPVSAAVWVSPIEVKGYKFFNSATGKEFIGRGIAFLPNANEGDFSGVHLNQKMGYYEPTSIDLFTDDLEDLWRPHLKNLKDLNVNLVRLYGVDGSKSHDKFFCALSELGMYAMVEVSASCDGCSIDVTLPAPQCYPQSLKTRMQQIVNAFIRYPNLLGISVGNEVNFFTKKYKGVLADTMACQKALVRDTQQYIHDCKDCRKVPIGVVISNEDEHIISKYMNCVDNDPMTSVDWFGVNLYTECGPKISPTYEGSEWEREVNLYIADGISVPMLATEYGCIHLFDGTNAHFLTNVKSNDGIVWENQRDWLSAGWIAGERNLQEVFQGGVAFSYSTLNKVSGQKYPFNKFASENYGIGYASPADCDYVNKACTYKKKPEFTYLAKQYKENALADSQLLKKSAFTPDPSRASPPACPTVYKSVSQIVWPTAASPDLPYTTAFAAPKCSASSGSTNSTTGSNNLKGTKAPDEANENDEGSSDGPTASRGSTSIAGFSRLGSNYAIALWSVIAGSMAFILS